MLRVDPKSLTKPEFVCTVYWMEGKLSQGDIANKIHWTPGQVRGWIWRSFEKTRHSMTDEERQSILNLLEPLRKEIGALDSKTYDDRFKAKKPKILPMKAKEEPDPEFPDTPEGRKASRKYFAEKKHKENAARHGRAKGHATRRGMEGSALEWLNKHHHLADPAEKKLSDPSARAGSSLRRLESGFRLRKYVEGSRLSPLGAMDYENATMGGGSGAKLALPAYRLHCISALGSIKKMMQPADYALIEAVVDKDKFVWEDFDPRSAGRRRVLEAVRYVLDIIACHDRLLTHEEFKELWGEDLPDVERPNQSVSRAMHEVAEQYFRSGYE